MIIRPQGKVTVVDGTTITGDHSVAVATAVHLKTKELYRARWVKITNATDARIVARRTTIQAIDATTGEPTHFEVIQNVETDNYPSMVIESGETVYLEKNPGMTPVDENGDYVVNQVVNKGQVYSLFQVDGAPTSGNVYVSPVAILG
jgi:hypothetical protein